MQVADICVTKLSHHCCHDDLPPARCLAINTLRPRHNGRHFANDIFNWIFSNENVWTSINILLKFVPKGQINNIPSLVQMMAWSRPSDKPLSEPMMVSSLEHICVTRSQWVYWTIAVLLFVGPTGKKLWNYALHNMILIQENWLKDGVCKMMVNLPRHRRVNSL